MNTYSNLVIAAIPALFSFIASYLAFTLTLSKHKRLIMPELAVKKLLSHKGYTDRSFKALTEALGGWDDNPNELRKILVRAGAIRINKLTKEMLRNAGIYLKENLKELRKSGVNIIFCKKLNENKKSIIYYINYLK